MVRKFESLMGKFMWNFSGKILRISMEDLKNPKLCGGLKLPCILNMSNALLTSQCLRLVRSGDRKTFQHLEYWLGDLLGLLSTDNTTGTVAADTPVHFEKIGILLTDLMISDALNASNFSSITNKEIYQVFMSDLCPPKIVRETGRDYRKVWRRLYTSVVESRPREILFMLIHNKLPIPERLFRISVKRDPYCETCLGAEISDIEHFFCTCTNVSLLWTWTKNRIMTLVQSVGVTDWELLNLLFPHTQYETEVVWLISNYIWFVWENIMVKSANVSYDKFLDI